MPSAVWSGHLHFGLVVMPVRLLVAARTKTTRFRRLYRKSANESLSVTSSPPFRSESEDDDSDLNGRVGMGTRAQPEEVKAGHIEQYEYSPVRQVLQSEVSGEEIGPGELVKGYEFAPNEFAVIDPQEIRAAAVETSDTIDVFHFVKATDVDPIYFERSYYVAPDPGGEKVYALLLKAMRKEECFGIARIGMHRRNPSRGQLQLSGSNGSVRLGAGRAVQRPHCIVSGVSFEPRAANGSSASGGKDLAR